MKNNKVGRIDISELNTPPEKHEYETAKYLTMRENAKLPGDVLKAAQIGMEFTFQYE